MRRRRAACGLGIVVVMGVMIVMRSVAVRVAMRVIIMAVTMRVAAIDAFESHERQAP